MSGSGNEEKRLGEATGDARTVLVVAGESIGRDVTVRLAGSPEAQGSQAGGTRTFGRFAGAVEIARGGMGAVYRAVDPDLGRPVAIKAILAGNWAGNQEVVRFLREAQITGQLQHPNIPPLHELSRTPQGEIYFAMKLIEGRSLAEVLADLRSKGPAALVAERPRLLSSMVKVCEALAYAHSRGVVHRDLKPANIMIGEFGEVLVMDWGLAKVSGQWPVISGQEQPKQQQDDRARPTAPDVTREGDVLGTPAYMSPEQAEGNLDALDARSDIYSLGAVLYEMLTGERPYTGRSVSEILARILEHDLEPPSARSPEARIPAELDRLVEKCLSREPSERYRSAEAVKNDLEAFLRDRPLSVVRYTPWARAAKWVRRNKGVAAFLAAVSILVPLLAIALVGARRASGLAREAEAEALDAQSEAERRAEAETIAKDEARARAEAETRARSEAQAQRERANQERDRAVARAYLARASEALRGRDRAKAAPLAALSVVYGELTGWPRLYDALDPLGGPLPRVVGSHEGRVNSAAFSPDGTRVVTASGDKTARIWPVSGGEPVVLRGHDDVVHSAAFSPDGTRVVTASDDKTARIWPVAGGEPVVLRGHEAEVFMAAFSPEGTWVVTASRDGTARIWPAAGGAPIVLRGHEGPVLWAAFSPDGTRVVTVSADTMARIWPVGGGEPAVLRGHEDEVFLAAFSPDGSRLVTVSWDKTARIWPVAGGAPAVLRGHEAYVYSAAFSPDGTRVVTASLDKTVRIWPVGGGEPVVLRGHASAVLSAAFSCDGTRIVTASEDNTARIWPVGGGDPLVLRGHERGLSEAAFSADGSRVVTASDDNTVRIWPVGGGEPVVVGRHPCEVSSVAFSPDGTRVVTASGDKAARIWPAGGGEPIVVLGHEGEVLSAVFSPDGTWVVTASYDKTARIWPVEGGEPVVLRGHEGPVMSAAFSPDGTRVVTASQDTTARVWPLEGGEPVVLRGHGGDLRSGVFSPDGTRVVTASADGTARIWPVGGGEQVVLRGHDGAVCSAAFSPDGTRVVTGSLDRTARIWPVGGGEPVVFRGEAAVASAAFSPDGNWVVTACLDNAARIWRVLGGESVVLRGHEDWVLSGSFSPDGTRVVTASADGTARIWNVSLLLLKRAEPLWEARLATALTLIEDEVRPEPVLLLPPAVARGVRIETERVPADLRKALSARPLREAAVERAVRFVLEAPDPAMAWLALYRALDGSQGASTRRLIVLEEIEKGEMPPLLQLATVVLREGLAFELGDKDARARIAAALKAARAVGPEHELVAAVAGWLGE